MPFGDYGGNNDSVVARLEFEMPSDADAKIDRVHTAVDAVKTSLESTNRFFKQFMDYVDELPKVEEHIKKLHQAHQEGLENTAEAYDQAADSGKQVSTPIPARTPGTGSGSAHIPRVDPAASAKHAHEHLDPDSLSKPRPVSATPIETPDAPPPSRPHDMSSAPPAPHYQQHGSASTPPPSYSQHPGSAPPPPAHSETSTSAPPPAYHTGGTVPSAPPVARTPITPVQSPTTPPHQAPVVGHSPVVTMPTVQEANLQKEQIEDYRASTQHTFTSSAPPPVHRPPSPVPVAERSLPSPEEPILPVQTEFGSSVLPPPSMASQVANLFSPAPHPTTTPPIPQPPAHHPAPPIGYDHPALRPSQPHTTPPERDRPVVPRTHEAAEHRPSIPPTEDVPSAESHVSDSSRSEIGRGQQTPTPQRPEPARTHPPEVISPLISSAGHRGDSDSGDRPARAGFPAIGSGIGKPPPVPGHERIQRHDDVQPVYPTVGSGGPPPRIGSDAGGPPSGPPRPPMPPPASGPGGAAGSGPHGSGQTIIHAETVNVTSDQSHVHSGQSTVHSAQTNVPHAESLAGRAQVPTAPAAAAATTSGIRRSDLVSTSVSPPPIPPEERRERQARFDESRARYAEEHGLPTPPSAAQGHPSAAGETTSSHDESGETRADGSRVIGHIPSTMRTAPREQSPPTPPPARTQHQPPAGTARAAGPTQNSRMDYRQRLGQQLGNNPQEIFDRLHQRGMVTETVSGDDQKQYHIKLGNKTVSSDEFMNDESLQSEALDALSHHSSPQSNENAGPIKRAQEAGGIIRNIGQDFRGGQDATQSISRLGSFVSSLGRGGGLAAEGAGAAGAGAAGAAGAAEAGAAGGMGAGLAGGIGGAITAGSRFLGPAGLAVGAVTAGNAMIQSGGQKIQGLYNEGTTRGGGVAAGAKIEASTAAMALNPFISNEQSRQVIMGALNTGAQGKDYDNVTAFMKDNLTNLNMSVADSAKLLDKNVKEGGQSIQDLGVQLEGLKTASQTGSKTFEQLKQEFIAGSANLVDLGAGGNAAGTESRVRGQVNTRSGPNGEPNALSGQMNDLLQGGANNPRQQAILGSQFDRGAMPDQVSGELANRGELTKDQLKLIEQNAQRALRNPRNAPSIMKQLMRSTGFGDISTGTAQELLNQYGAPGSADRNYNEAQAQITQQTGNVTTHHTMGAPNIGDQVSAFGSSIAKDFHRLIGDTAGAERDQTNIDQRQGSYTNPALDTVTRQYGMSNVVAYDPEGKPHRVDYNDKALMEGVQSGAWRVAAATNPEQQRVLHDDFNRGAGALQRSSRSLTELASTAGSQQGGQGVGTGGQFSLTPDAARLLTLIPNNGETQNDPNNLNANAGANGATHNNPPPGNAGHPFAVPMG